MEEEINGPILGSETVFTSWRTESDRLFPANETFVIFEFESKESNNAVAPQSKLLAKITKKKGKCIIPASSQNMTLDGNINFTCP